METTITRVTRTPGSLFAVETPHGLFGLDDENLELGQIVRVGYEPEGFAILICFADASPIGDDGCCQKCGVSYWGLCDICHRAGLHADGCPDSDATPHPTWPKPCGCGKSYNAATWAALKFVGWYETENDDGLAYFLELRNCSCGSTLAVDQQKCDTCGEPVVEHAETCPVNAEEKHEARKEG